MTKSNWNQRRKNCSHWSKQGSKREELTTCENELAESKQHVVEAEVELKQVTEKETSLAKKSSGLLVREIDFSTARLLFEFYLFSCLNYYL